MLHNQTWQGFKIIQTYFSITLHGTGSYHKTISNHNCSNYVNLLDPTTVEFNKKITTEVKKLHAKKEINNLSKFEYRAVLNLSKNRDIVINQADKGSITVIMDHSTYLQEGYRQLNNPQHYR